MTRHPPLRVTPRDLMGIVLLIGVFVMGVVLAFAGLWGGA